ncbi:hypothetical protein GIB67_032785 [Kingdonia uniflora]|uniref:Uncharacterized protein n=1 Tax=Kingdonia uniflora TaxID=39325 RepID=A0A7J7MWU6_9MAGN|nr:hypothetical protein GIB67_032785 [Kingdonia uniflora]
MEKEGEEDTVEALLPSIQLTLAPKKMEPSKRVPISRCGSGSDGRPISLLANHFNVSLKNHDGVFFQYNVSITYEDKKSVDGKRIGRKVMDKVYQTYSSELAGKHFAYDGEKILFTVGPLPQNTFEFSVVLEESYVNRNGSPDMNGSPSEKEGKRAKRLFLSNTFNVEIRFAAEIPLKSIALALQGKESENTTEAIRVLDIILRQQSAKSFYFTIFLEHRGCLLVRQSFFHEDVKSLVDIGGGISACRGLHASFCTTQAGLSLNMDVSSTMILTPGPVLDFLKKNQNVEDLRQIDWGRAKRVLKNMRVKTQHNKMEFKIIGLSEKPCNQQIFSLKSKDRTSGDVELQTVEITVYNYFTQHKGIQLSSCAYMPCLDVGKPKRPNYLPLELCSLVSLQRYTKALSTRQRSSLVEKSRQKPLERIQAVTDAVSNYSYNEDPMLSSCGISVEKQLIQINGRVLKSPKRLFEPTKIQNWAVVNFSTRFDTSSLCRQLIDCGRSKGIHIERPHSLIEEDAKNRRLSPILRVEKMFEQMKSRLSASPEFLLCLLPERKNCDIYGPWKMKNLYEMGICTQCISPVKINDQYLSNVLLKINSKLGGINSLLDVEHVPSIPLVTEVPTMILGIDVSHGSPGQSDSPSIAAVVGSRYWPKISRYRASVRTQPPKVEMVESLYKLLPNGEDDGIIRELLVDFFQTSNGRKPKQIIIFRDGVSESQFNQVLNIELEQIIKAFQHFGETWLPKFTVIVAQKNHHTKLFQAGGHENVPAGTVVDTKIVHPRYYDFYMCAQAGMIGTSRPTHYHVLLDEIGFSADNLQNLVHSLCYVYQRSTAAISIVAPISYAHLAAAQMGKFITYDDLSDSSSSGNSSSPGTAVPIRELPRLHDNVKESMFFC